MFDQSYKTPEGFELYRPLLLPGARSFADVLEYISEWDYETMSRGDAAPAPRIIRHAPGAELRGNRVGPYAHVDMSQLGGVRSRGMAVRATDATMEVVRGRIVTDDDHLSFKLIAHQSTGRVLVILDHGYIIGSHWLAYVDPATVPAMTDMP